MSSVETPEDPKRDGHNPAGVEERRSEEWRRILTGQDRGLMVSRRLWSAIPSSPRCKLCHTPFAGPGRLLSGLIMHGRSSVNPLMCSMCFTSLGKHPGGAEIETTVLFADVRGSTGLAERAGADVFRSLIQQFYTASSRAIDGNGGQVDKFLGDGVMALFLPVFSGEDHRGRAIAAGIAILEAAARPEVAGGGVRVGVGIHTGEAFVGAIGSSDRLDFTALGDTVNVAARLGGEAGPGELLVSAATWDGTQPSIPAAARRQIEIRGRAAGLEVIVAQPPGVAVAPRAA